MSVAQLMKCYNYLIHMEPQITDFMQRTILNLNTQGLEVSFIGDENRIKSVHSFLQKCNRPDRDTRYKDAPKKYEPCFDDPVVRTVWRAFRKFRKSGGKG